jgi:hypothetical protein
MDFNATIDLIIKDLNEASAIIDDLKKYPGVPILQVELAKSKCRSAGEVIALLKSITIPVSEVSEAIQESQPIRIQTESPVSEKPAKVKPLQKEPVTSDNPGTIIEKKTKPADVVKAAETSMVADKFSQKADLYDTQSASIKIEKDLSDRLKVKPLASLTEAIGISDKFLFISEIFDGNKEAYAQAISRLDKAENIEDAKAIILSYTGEKPESDAVAQLLELVKIKLPSNE